MAMTAVTSCYVPHHPERHLDFFASTHHVVCRAGRRHDDDLPGHQPAPELKGKNRIEAEDTDEEDQKGARLQPQVLLLVCGLILYTFLIGNSAFWSPRRSFFCFMFLLCDSGRSQAAVLSAAARWHDFIL
jgi:hypothetical protein